jgi:hypothetical protein
MISLHPLKRFASMRRPFAPPSISSGNAKSRRDLKLSKINQERSIISYSALIVNWKISKTANIVMETMPDDVPLLRRRQKARQF